MNSFRWDFMYSFFHHLVLLELIYNVFPCFNGKSFRCFWGIGVRMISLLNIVVTEDRKSVV